MNSGDVPRVDGQLAVARAFGDKSLKKHLSSEPDLSVEFIENDTEFVILASDGLWKVGFVIFSGHATQGRAQELRGLGRYKKMRSSI